ncbi:hypothetical protein [Acutalibacter caecimuris]|uniref:hypothetical protein n=1 Tax=Acutalibacter caecimuris TaxID=3093657 RepID=UPI002AC89933|nr:hypothetical protein [Acutalibacter sp. M00118]
MPKLYLKPSSRPSPYPNGGDEAYWMHKLAAAMKKELAGHGIDCVLGGSPPPGCGLWLYLSSHAAPAEMQARIKGAGLSYYAYSPSAKQAAGIFTAALQAIYPQPELVEAAPTPAREELRDAKAPALLIQLGYHDNPQDEAWLTSSILPIAVGLAKAAAGFLYADAGV